MTPKTSETSVHIAKDEKEDMPQDGTKEDVQLVVAARQVPPRAVQRIEPEAVEQVERHVARQLRRSAIEVLQAVPGRRLWDVHQTQQKADQSARRTLLPAAAKAAEAMMKSFGPTSTACASFSQQQLRVGKLRVGGNGQHQNQQSRTNQ